MSLRRRRFFFVALAFVAFAIPGIDAPLIAQAPAGPPQVLLPGLPPPPNPVERLGHHLFRVGQMRVDTAKREIVVPGHVNDAHVLEFVASTNGGFKAYESALSLEAGGYTLNAALLLIGLDKAHARVPTKHFDPVAPAGDPVEIWVEWSANGQTRRERVEELMFDVRTRQPMPAGPWVYTGSTFVRDGAFLADLDGVLIGFVHSPAPLIENPRAGAVDSYGSVVLNPNLGLRPGSPVTVTIRALSEKR
jgi:hypothetical protein